MHELTDLYQQLILDHYRSPRNRRRLEHPDRTAEGYNPLCGDRITLDLALDGDVVTDVGFEGVGCAISTAAASLMTQAIKGRSIEQARALSDRFRRLVTSEQDAQEAGDPELGKLAALAGVRRYPARVKCATLAWHTLEAALQGERETVSTE